MAQGLLNQLFYGAGTAELIKFMVHGLLNQSMYGAGVCLKN
jgi:hypothetical protein